MTRSEAANYLGLTSHFQEDELLEAIENHLFTIRNYFLTEPVQRLLYHSRIQKLMQLAEVSLAFDLQPSKHENLEINTLRNTSNLEDLYRFKELVLASYRTFMASKLHLNNAILAAEAMIALETEYEDQFIALNTDTPTWHDQVKSTERIESSEALMELKKNPVSAEFLIALRKEKRRIMDAISRR